MGRRRPKGSRQAGRIQESRRWPTKGGGPGQGGGPGKMRPWARRGPRSRRKPESKRKSSSRRRSRERRRPRAIVAIKIEVQIVSAGSFYTISSCFLNY